MNITLLLGMVFTIQPVSVKLLFTAVACVQVAYAGHEPAYKTFSSLGKCHRVVMTIPS